MKSLHQHIEERLIVNKNYKGTSYNINDFSTDGLFVVKFMYKSYGVSDRDNYLYFDYMRINRVRDNENNVFDVNITSKINGRTYNNKYTVTDDMSVMYNHFTALNNNIYTLIINPNNMKIIDCIDSIMNDLNTKYTYYQICDLLNLNSKEIDDLVPNEKYSVSTSYEELNMIKKIMTHS